jgi:hypothetical protein
MSALLDLDLDAPAHAAEHHRRRMLAEADYLLDQVEELRLAKLHAVPPALGDAVRSLQVRLGRCDAGRPRTVRAAQHLVFAVQARLMAANPRNPQPRHPAGRPSGTPHIAPLRQGGAWKFLVLPPRPALSKRDDEFEADWRRHASLTVQRALDRWSCAQAQAVVAARLGRDAVAAVRRAQAGWTNYWELRCEAEELINRASRGRGWLAGRPP